MAPPIPGGIRVIAVVDENVVAVRVGGEERDDGARLERRVGGDGGEHRPRLVVQRAGLLAHRRVGEDLGEPARSKMGKSDGFQGRNPNDHYVRDYWNN